jgi:hypothetical protein
VVIRQKVSLKSCAAFAAGPVLRWPEVNLPFGNYLSMHIGKLIGKQIPIFGKSLIAFIFFKTKKSPH